MFGAGGEHLHTLSAEGKTADTHHLQLVNWLDDSTVSAVSGAEVSVWSVSQEQYKEVVVFAAIPQVNITYMAASPNGRFLAAACENGMVGWPDSGAVIRPGGDTCARTVRQRKGVGGSVIVQCIGHPCSALVGQCTGSTMEQRQCSGPYGGTKWLVQAAELFHAW